MKHTFTKKPAYFESKPQIVPNSLVYNKNLSDSAIRLLLALNALPDKWVIYQCDIRERLGWGRDKMQSAIKECVQFGFMKVTKTRSEQGRFEPNDIEFELSPVYLEKPSHNECEPTTGLPSRQEPQRQTLPLPSFSDSKLIDIEYTTTASQEETEVSASPVVVFSSLEKLEIKDTLKQKICAEHSEDAINLAVERCLRWKSRSSDEVGILFALKNASNWVDVLTESEVQEKNLQVLNSIRHLDMQKSNNVQIFIGPNYVEFIFNGHSSSKILDANDKDFILLLDQSLLNYNFKK